MAEETNPFYSYKCTPEALGKMQAVREAYKLLSDALDSLLAEDKEGVKVNVGGREMSLAKTNLEQSSMWAIKSISHYNVQKQ